MSETNMSENMNHLKSRYHLWLSASFLSCVAGRVESAQIIEQVPPPAFVQQELPAATIDANGVTRPHPSVLAGAPLTHSDDAPPVAHDHVHPHVFNHVVDTAHNHIEGLEESKEQLEQENEEFKEKLGKIEKLLNKQIKKIHENVEEIKEHIERLGHEQDHNGKDQDDEDDDDDEDHKKSRQPSFLGGLGEKLLNAGEKAVENKLESVD